MIEDQNSIDRLLDKLSGLMKRQDAFQKEIEDLRREIYLLQSRKTEKESEPSLMAKPEKEPVIFNNPNKQFTEIPFRIPHKEKQPAEFRQNLEKFIGENLLNKIGIVILIIGVGIGAKYAIDHDLISPWTRIILGYLLGMGLLGIAFRLRKQYENFSAVLLSGSMAILYFITFAAFSFYALIPIILTFSLMVLFTVFTVIAAIQYNRAIFTFYNVSMSSYKCTLFHN